MIIRRAAETDADAICGIWNGVIRDSLVTFNSVERSKSEIAEMIAGGALAMFVSEADGAISGFAFYNQFRGGAGYALTMEHSIHLVPAARGRGVGRALMSQIEQDAAKGGAHTMFAGVSSENPAGRAFHARLGYREVAVLPEVGWKWGRLLDLHLMQKRLSPPSDRS